MTTTEPYTRGVVRALLVLAFAMLSASCSTLLTPEPTPVPGAAATLTRSIRTPIPTPERSASPSPAVSPAAIKPSVGPSPSAVATRPTSSDDDTAQLQRRFDQTIGDPRLPGVEDLLLDHVSLSTPQGGSVLDNDQAASWLRDRATTGITVTRTDAGTQSVMVQVVTEGWPNSDPIQQGRVIFTLRRYDRNGKADEENGAWKVDVIETD
jgi:hypothetical protein